MKVVVVDWTGLASPSDDPIIAEGESDGRLVDKEYVRVGKQLYYAAYVYQDSTALRALAHATVAEIKRLRRKSDQTMYQAINEARSSRADLIAKEEE